MRQRWGWMAVMLALAAPMVGAQESVKPERKPQSAVAAKDKAFATVAADAAEVKAAKKADDLPGAKTLIGKTATFTGTVTKVFQPKGNSRILLNFAKDYKKAVVGMVEAADFSKFPDLTTLEGKKVLITGKVSDFKGQPEVLLTNLTAVKVIP